MRRKEVTFRSGTDTCAAGLYAPAGERTDGTVPLIVTAHGLTGTRRDGLGPATISPPLDSLTRGRSSTPPGPRREHEGRKAPKRGEGEQQVDRESVRAAPDEHDLL